MPTTKQTKNQRRKLRFAQQSICAGCGQHLPSVRRVKKHHPDYPTFDHVVPKSLGGRRVLTNGLLKHRRCNGLKANRCPSGCDLIWLAAVQFRLEALEHYRGARHRGIVHAGVLACTGQVEILR